MYGVGSMKKIVEEDWSWLRPVWILLKKMRVIFSFFACGFVGYDCTWGVWTGLWSCILGIGKGRPDVGGLAMWGLLLGSWGALVAVLWTLVWIGLGLSSEVERGWRHLWFLEGLLLMWGTLSILWLCLFGFWCLAPVRRILMLLAKAVGFVLLLYSRLLRSAELRQWSMVLLFCGRWRRLGWKLWMPSGLSGLGLDVWESGSGCRHLEWRTVQGLVEY